MEYYLAIKKNEIMPFAATWMNLETVILSEGSQTEEDKYHMAAKRENWEKRWLGSLGSTCTHCYILDG